jgi:hypothetical protein
MNSKNKTFKDASKKHRADYIAVHLRLSDMVYQILNDSKGMTLPTPTLLAKRTGLSVKTVQRHYDTLEFQPVNSPLRSLSDRVIVNMFNLTRKSAAAQKLWFEIMEGWSEESIVNVNDIELAPIPKSKETMDLADQLLDALMKEADAVITK